jgi:phage shock protein PspC (stress-responsive transcriptional regulator)
MIAGISGILAGIGPIFISDLETFQYINASLAMIWFFFVGLKLYKLGQQ